MTDRPDDNRLALTEMSAVEGTCEGCNAPDGVPCADDCPIQIDARTPREETER